MREIGWTKGIHSFLAVPLCRSLYSVWRMSCPRRWNSECWTPWRRKWTWQFGTCKGVAISAGDWQKRESPVSQQPFFSKGDTYWNMNNSHSEPTLHVGFMASEKMALGFWSLFCADSAMRLSVGGSWRLKSMTSHNGRMLSPRGGYKRFGLEMLRWIVGIKSEIITTLIRHSGLSCSFVKAAFSTGWNRLTVDLKRELEQRLLDANSKTQHTLADLRQEWDARAAQVPRHGQHATYSVWWDVCCFFFGVAAVLQCCSNHSSEWILIALTPLLLVQDSWLCRMKTSSLARSYRCNDKVMSCEENWSSRSLEFRDGRRWTETPFVSLYLVPTCILKHYRAS